MKADRQRCAISAIHPVLALECRLETSSGISSGASFSGGGRQGYFYPRQAPVSPASIDNAASFQAPLHTAASGFLNEAHPQARYQAPPSEVENLRAFPLGGSSRTAS